MGGGVRKPKAEQGKETSVINAKEPVNRKKLGANNINFISSLFGLPYLSSLCLLLIEGYAPGLGLFTFLQKLGQGQEEISHIGPARRCT